MSALSETFRDSVARRKHILPKSRLWRISYSSLHACRLQAGMVSGGTSKLALYPPLAKLPTNRLERRYRMRIYSIPLTIRCACGYTVEQQETDIVRKPRFHDLDADGLPPGFKKEFKNREILEVGFWITAPNLPYLHCPQCCQLLYECRLCETFNEFEFMDPDGSGTMRNMCCRNCKRPMLQCQ